MDIRVSAFVATSLDGYIARLNGKMDWLEKAAQNAPTSQQTGLQVEGMKGQIEDYGYRDFFASVGCVILGRNTFEKAVAFESWPYDTKRVIVISRRLKKIPDQFMDRADLFTGPEEMLIVQLQSLGIRRVCVEGGLTIQSFIRSDLLNDITITRVPVMLGKGISLFGPLANDVYLQHRQTRTFDNGFVQSQYEFDRYSRTR